MPLAAGVMPREDGDADAPGALADGTEGAPLADWPGLALAAGVLFPLAENWFGLPGACCG